MVLAAAGHLKAIVEASGVDRRVEIGASRLALDARVTIDPDKLFGRRLGVFGNTGSGKSCTVAGLIRWSIQAAANGKSGANARFIVPDPNGEYRHCFKDLRHLINVKVFSVEPREDEFPLQVPAWMWNGHEWAGAVDASPGAQRPVLMQALRQLRAAAISGAEPQEPSKRLLIAAHLRAMLDYLREALAQGVTTLASFPRFKAIHENLEGFQGQLEAMREAASSEEEALILTALNVAIQSIKSVRQRRSHEYKGEHWIDQLQAADIEEVIAGLDALVIHLPDAAVIEGPTEDMPARFDPYRLSDAINFLATLQSGNLQQHMGGWTFAFERCYMTRVSHQSLRRRATASRSLIGFGPSLVRKLIEDRFQSWTCPSCLRDGPAITTIVSVVARLIFEAAQRHRQLTGATLPTVMVLEEPRFRPTGSP